MSLTATLPPEVIPPASAPPVGADDVVVLAVVAPFYLSTFESGVDGWEPITRVGTPGPGSSVEQVVTVASSYGVTLERR